MKFSGSIEKDQSHEWFKDLQFIDCVSLYSLNSRKKARFKQNRVGAWGFYLKIFNFSGRLTKKDAKTKKQLTIQVQKKETKALNFSHGVKRKVKHITIVIKNAPGKVLN